MTAPTQISFRPSRREAVYLALLALGTLAIQFVTLPAEPNGPDAVTYLAIAREQISDPGFWADPGSLVGNFWAVGYPTALALVLWVSGASGDSLTVVVVVQAVLVASLVLVPWVLSRGLPRPVQWVAPALLALSPALWWMGGTIGYEALLAWLVGFSFASAWILYHRGAGRRRLLVGALAALSGLFMALALLTQTKVIVLIPVVGYLLIRAGRLPALTAGLAFLAGLLPWMVRNALVLGNPSPLSGNGGYNLWVGNNPDATTGGSMLVAPPTPNGESMTSAALQFIISQPEKWIELTWMKAARLLQPVFVYFDQVPVGPPRTALHLYATLVSLIVAVGVVAFLGAWLIKGARSVPPIAPLAAAVLLWFVSHLPFIAESRFMTTLLPLSITVAAAAWWMVVARLRSRAGSRAAEDHLRVQELERRGMPVALDLSIPSWRADAIVRDAHVIEPSSTITVPAQSCGLSEEQHSWPDLHVRTLSGVLLDADSGLVFAGDRVIAQSGTGTRASRDAAFVSGATFRIHEADPITMPGPIAPLGDVHHHYHVMIETLPRLLHAQAYRPDVTFVTSHVIPERYRKVLDDWGVRVRDVPPGTVIQAEELILVDQPELFWPRRADVTALRQAFDVVEAAGPHERRIFISRFQASRSMDQETLLAERLRDAGFDVVVLESLDVSAQVSVFVDSHVVTAAHGAGLSGIAFMEAGSSVVEITSGELFEECYRRLAAVTGVAYSCVAISGSAQTPHGTGHEAASLLEFL